MSINRTIVKTWIADTPNASVQAKIEKIHKTKVIKNLRLETAPK